MRIRYQLLAKSIPEYSKRDNSIYTCSIGFSSQLGLMRIYPLPPSGMNKWGIYDLEVEKNKRDNRTESWKLSSYARKENWVNLSDDVKHISNSYKTDHLLSYSYPSISEMNKKRVSIGFIKADKFNVYWDKNDRYINDRQIGMFEDVELADFTSYTKESKEAQARIIFKDGDGKHNIQFNEWGVFEYMRKFGCSKDAFRFLIPNEDSYILLGNINAYRSKWMALGVFNIVNQLSLTF